VAVDDLADRRVDAARGAVLSREPGRRTEIGPGPDRDPADLARRIDELAALPVNYDPADGPVSRDDRRWHVDDGRAVIGQEGPGPPEPDGPWERAGSIVRDYGFTDHRRLRGAYRPSAPLLGRDMLLEGRFAVMRFHLGVRVTDIVDTERDGHRVWGWSYETLSGHLEQGRLTYEVDKDLASGEVTFWIRAFSRRARVPNPFYRLGFALFGRAVQLGFYHSAGQRVRELVGSEPPGPEPGADVVVAPRHCPEHWWDRWAVHVYQPGA
jgi:uncharacterized protein (UPF0548 family)